MDHPTLCIVAGEHSGDAHAGHLVQAFRKLEPESRWFGAGGGVMEESGVELLVPMERLSVVGIGEVLVRLPGLVRSMALLKEAVRTRKPDALVLVDLPDFNFRLGRFAHGIGVPVIYYITPQVWAWRPGRTRFLRECVEKALVILPFEEAFLRARGVDAVFVGHPLSEHPPVPCDRAEFCARHGFDPDQPIVGLLPGSRSSEIRRILPLLIGVADHLSGYFPNANFAVPWAPALPEELTGPFRGSRVRFLSHQYHDLLGNSDAAAVASGTATLEATLLEVPHVVVYRLQRLTYAIGRRLVKVPHVSLPNVILGESRVPEFIQDDFTAESVGNALRDLLRSPVESRANAAHLGEAIRRRLGDGGASRRAAEALRSCLEALGRG